jgi:hypothetical protein
VGERDGITLARNGSEWERDGWAGDFMTPTIISPLEKRGRCFLLMLHTPVSPLAGVELWLEGILEFNLTIC